MRLQTRLVLVLTIALAASGVQARADAMPVAAVEQREVELTYPADGVVEAVRQATVAAQVQGRVTEMRVDAGDRVKRGDVLVRIDEREAAQAVAGAEASVAAAQANLANAQATYERTKNLHAQKFVSKAALDQAEAAWRAAQAELKAAQAGRGQAGTAHSFATVTAPIAGVVAQRHAEQGEMATPGKPLLTLYEPGSLRVVASVPQYKLAEVRQGLRARIEFPESGRWVDAAALTVLPTADARSHTVKVRADLPAEVQGAVPGMYARVHFVTGRAKKLVVPADAVLRRGEVTAVYVLGAEGRTSLRQVRLGEAVAGGAVEVLAGVAAGESVSLAPVKTGIATKQLVSKR
jgi:RND family efflux transporter MFP subunit